MNQNTRQNLIILLVGLLAVAMGIIALVSEKSTDRNNTESAAATVISYEEAEEYDSGSEIYSTVYSPVVRFTASGTETEAAYSQRYSKKEFEIGEEIPIHYDPENPRNFSIDGDRRGSFVAAWEIPVGVLMMAFAAYRYMKEKRKRRIERGCL